MLQTAHTFEHTPKNQKTRKSLFINELRDNFVVPPGSVLQEIDGVINQYKKKYSHLTVVLTGGDTNFLSKQLKSSIFAHQNFLLEGLNEILIFNSDT